MLALQALEAMLDSDTVEFFGFNAKNAVINTKIKANYLAKEQDCGGVVLFSFIAEDDGECYVKSVFSKEAYDYTIRQTRYTVLLKEKTTITQDAETTVELFRHEAYTVI